MMSVTCNFSVAIFMMYTSSHVWMLSMDILLNVKEYDKCSPPVVCHKNVSVNNKQLNVTIWLVSVDEEFHVLKTVRSVYGDVMIMASLSPCQRHFSPSSYITVCPLVCSTFLSSQSIYIQSVLNATNTEQTNFNALVRHDSMEDAMTGITAILWHVKWKTVVVITSEYGVLTALSGGRLASIKLQLYVIDDPNNPLANIDLASIYQLLLEEDLNLLVMCPPDCIQKLLYQGRLLESNMSVAKAIRGPQWLIVPSTGSVMDLAHSVEPFQTENIVFLEFMPCSRSYSPLNLDVITQHSTSSEQTNMTYQAAEITESLQKSATDGEYSVQAKLKVLGRGHSGTNVETVGYIGRDDSVEVKHPLYHANNDVFHNRTLIVGTLEWPPFVIRRVENGSVKFDGLCIQLLQELAKQLNFSYVLVEPEDKEWSRILNGSWTGLVKLLTDGDVDMIVAPMAVTESRNTVIDFTVPYFYVHSALIFKKQDPNTNKWLTLLSLFRYEVLVCIFVSFIFSTVILFVIEEVTPVHSWTDERPSDMRTRYGDIFWYHFGALMANGGAYLPKTESGRTVLSCWWLFTVIMAATYSGNLIAFLTDGREKPPFSSLAEMVQQDTYKWGFVGGTALVTLFQESNISVYHKVWHGVEEIMANEPDWLSLDEDEHMRRAVESQYVYMAEESALEMWDDPRRCDLQMLHDNFQFSKYAVGLPKHSIYTQVFSEQILRIYESGILSLWWDRWKPKHRCPSPSRKAKRVDLLTLQSAFYGAGVGVAISLLILVCEIIHKRRCNQKQQRKSECVEEHSMKSDTSSQELSHPDIPSST
ncbi:glutamate receptor ionotropic, kainate 3-like [Haliotis rubra]|uniref:glutamate receptor ionotropic, kainate 3-like n=1 Tax=Haliotis rubra TaxID=36100 RepID=UPI001EE5D38F|nr:glutamate receptor ionotropic, kainate 3-like [Haliotis rubra]